MDRKQVETALDEAFAAHCVKLFENLCVGHGDPEAEKRFATGLQIAIDARARASQHIPAPIG